MEDVVKKTVNVSTCMGSFECVLTHNDPDKGYTVTVPRLKGVVTFGDDEREAVRMVREAIELHCGCLLEKGLAEVRPKRKEAVRGKSIAVRK